MRITESRRNVLTGQRCHPIYDSNPPQPIQLPFNKKPHHLLLHWSLDFVSFFFFIFFYLLALCKCFQHFSFQIFLLLQKSWVISFANFSMYPSIWKIIVYIAFSGVSIKTFQNTRSPYRYKNGLLLPVIDVPLLLKTYLISRTLFLCRLRFFLII